MCKISGIFLRIVENLKIINIDIPEIEKST